MKHISWMLPATLVLVLVSSANNTFAKVYAGPGQEVPIENPMDAIASGPAQPHDADRTQQLLDIWKGHVKTLTRERDEAYKEIEALKNQGANRVGNIRTQDMGQAERDSANRSIAALKSQLLALQTENQQLKMSQPRDVASVDQDLKTELTTLRSENQKLKLANKEKVESNSDKEVILREKEEALRQLEYLKDKMLLLQKKYDLVQSESQKTGTSSGDLEENRTSSSELRSLQAKADKLRVVETELQEARDYFASYMKELDARNKQLIEENITLKSKLESLSSN